MSKPETSLVTIAAAKKPPITPPLRKTELLRATAWAMYLDGKAKHEAATALRDEKVKVRDKAIVKAARKLLRNAKTSICDWHGPYEVRFTVNLNKAEFAELQAEVNKVAIPKLRASEDIYQELRRAAVGDGERWMALIQDKSIAAKLVESGNRLLNGERT